MSGRGRGGGGGRGAYYKNRYGNKRGRSEEESFDVATTQSSNSSGYSTTRSWEQLDGELKSLDGQSYGQYKRLLGRFDHLKPHFTLHVDHVQGDAYAAPSRVRVTMPWTETHLPSEYLQSGIRQIAVADFVSRVAGNIIQTKHLDQNVQASQGGGGSNGGWSAPKGGAFSICRPGQEILPRTSAIVSGDDTIELRFTVNLPAAGRTILGQQAQQILVSNLVHVVENALLHANLNQDALTNHVTTSENQDFLRLEAEKQGLVAFIANGSVLPRASGAAQTPMRSGEAVPFASPSDFEVTLQLPDGTKVTGMGIPHGVTLLTGGGFHGKSTLLQALELGIYNHVPGDGREGVVTAVNSVKIRAEDGRCVSKTDISPFISKLPGGKDTTAFSTEDASGSTSMAANIQEALEVGCGALLIDEDCSATNLLVRDHRMQSLIKNEPITPLISKVRALYDQHGVSTIIVIGGLGDWLSVADHVILMDSYVPHCINQEAQNIIDHYPSHVAQDTNYGSLPQRKFKVDFTGFRQPYATRKRFITLNKEVKDAVNDPSQAESGVDIGGLDQIVEIGQSRLIANGLGQIAKLTSREELSLGDILRRLNAMTALDTCLPTSLVGGDLVAVRPLELAAALSRMRGVVMRVEKA